MYISRTYRSSNSSSASYLCHVERRYSREIPQILIAAAAAAAAAAAPSSSSSSSSGESVKPVIKQPVPVYSAQRRRAGLGYSAKPGSSSGSSTESIGGTISSSSSSSRSFSSYEDAVAFKLDLTSGRWPFYTYTQNWEQLSIIGRAALESQSPRSLFDFANSVDMRRLILACDAEIAAGCPMHACQVYDLILEVQDVRQAAAAAAAVSDDLGGKNLYADSCMYPWAGGDILSWVGDPVGRWMERHPGVHADGLLQTRLQTDSEGVAASS